MIVSDASDEFPLPVATDAATTVRRVIEQLDTLAPATNHYLAGLAFILTRVADADQDIHAAERSRIEALLNEYAQLSEEQAVLVAEIARHRWQYADCGCSYGVSRNLRSQVSRDQRRAMLRSLFAVAVADGSISAPEKQTIRQIASELGFTRQEVETARTQVASC